MLLGFVRRFQLFFFIMNTLELFGPFHVPALALDLGHCTLFLILMHCNFLKRILLGTLGVECSSQLGHAADGCLRVEPSCHT